MTRPSSFLLVLPLVLAACGQESEPAAEPPGSADASEARADPASAPLDGVTVDPPFPNYPGESAPVGFSSEYSELDLDACNIVERRPEATSATWRCGGPSSVPFWVKLGDGRYDIDAGERVERDFATIGAFNEIEPTLEWRMADGEPFALIFRYRDVAIETPDRTVLAVEKLARDGEAGCRVAQIDGSTPRANDVARQIADQQVRRFECGTDEPRFIGEAR